jgi:Undecaprenyl-phosphate glucose phosphotransferase
MNETVRPNELTMPQRETAGQQKETAGRRIAVSSNIMAGVVAVIDSSAIVLVGSTFYFIFANINPDKSGAYFSAIGFIWVTILLLFQFSGLYQFEAIVAPIRFLDKLFISFVTSFLFLLALGFTLKISTDFSRVWIASFSAGAAALTLGSRLVIAKVAVRLSNEHVFRRNVIVAGTGEQCRRLLGTLQASPRQFISVVGVFGTGASTTNAPLLGANQFTDIAAFVRTNQVDDVIIALPWSAEEETVALLEQLRELPVNVYLASDLIGLRLDLRQPPSHFGTLPVFEVLGRPISGWGIAAKRAEDLVIGVLATLLLLPLMAAIALLIKLDSDGPVFFRQKRLGFNNHPFDILKFRTMTPDAGHSTKTVQATRDDPRVTRMGRFLRRSSLDELPQLVNVLKGEMSLVGPRPHAIDHNEEYARKVRWYFARHRVKPGMTGWAQVNGLRGETETTEKMEARVKFDIFYTENWSVVFDLRILVKTAWILLTARNAY